MNDPMAIILIVVLVSAAVALWMLDGTYRGRLLKTGKRAADAEDKASKLSETVAELRSERDKTRQRIERLEKDRDTEREQVRKLKAKVKRQAQSKAVSSQDVVDDSDELKRVNAELKVLRTELETRLGEEAGQQSQLERMTEELEDARERLASFEAQAKKMSRGVRVRLVDSDVEAAKEDLPAFMKRIKTEMAILERKVVRNHEAFLSQQGKTDVATEKLKTMRDRYRAVCRELAVLISGNQNLDEQEAQAVAEEAVEAADDAASWVGSESLTDEVAGDEDAVALAPLGADQEPADAETPEAETSEAQETASDTDEVAQEDQAADETPATDEAADEQQAAEA